VEPEILSGWRINLKATPKYWEPVSKQKDPAEPPNQHEASETLHRRTSYTYQSQATSPSVAPTERQQELRERAESVRGSISVLEAALLNENIPEEQRRDAQAGLQQLRSTMA
jgi:hypothetical protein